MVVGVIDWELEVFGAQSLKDKRRVVRSLKDRLRARLNVSVTEVAHQDLWQRAGIAACVVATDRAGAEQVLQSADRLVAGEARARIIRVRSDYY